MIVNSVPEGWEIIYQRSHALLAAVLVEAWEPEYRPKRWVETLAAIIQHDDQENYWQGAHHLSESGAPLNFDEVPLQTSKVKARTIIQNAAQQSVWVAWLISRHNSYLYEGQRGNDAELDAFLDEQITRRQTWLKTLPEAEDEMERTYRLFLWGDRLSLILCQRELQSQPDNNRDELTLEICEGPDDELHTITRQPDNTFQLHPWRFDENQLTFTAEARILRQTRFEDDEEFRARVECAPIVTREWTFSK